MNTQDVQNAGFAAVRRSPKRLICNIQGLTKSGKTRLALTAPKPLGYIAIEIGGDEGVVDQFIPEGMDQNEEIQIVRVRMDDPVYPTRGDFPSGKDGERNFDAAVSAAIQSVAEIAMDQFYGAYYASLANFRTTVVDTGTDLWELIRLSNFGRLEKIPQLAYTQVNKQFDALMDTAYSNAGSVVWLHHLKERWEQYVDPTSGKERGRPTGVFDLAGYGGVKKKVQASIELWREDLEEEDPETGLHVRFNAQVVDSRHSAASVGKKFTTLDISFDNIAKSIVGGWQ